MGCPVLADGTWDLTDVWGLRGDFCTDTSQEAKGFSCCELWPISGCIRCERVAGQSFIIQCKLVDRSTYVIGKEQCLVIEIQRREGIKDACVCSHKVVVDIQRSCSNIGTELCRRFRI